MKGTTVIYIDSKGKEHEALVRAVNGFHTHHLDVAYINVDAPEGDNVVTVFNVSHVTSQWKQEANPELPTVILNAWKHKGEASAPPPPPDHPMFDHPFAAKPMDEFGRVVEKPRPEYAAQVAEHQEANLPTSDDLDAVAAEQKAKDDTSSTPTVRVVKGSKGK